MDSSSGLLSVERTSVAALGFLEVTSLATLLLPTSGTLLTLTTGDASFNQKVAYDLTKVVLKFT